LIALAVHEVEVRLIVEHVIVDGGNLDPVHTQRFQDRVHFLRISGPMTTRKSSLRG
jgi:hypothetical protein